MVETAVRHVLGLSGGKDSAALAIYMRDRVPEMEYFFADTGAELPETLEFIEVMQDYLGKNIVRLNPERDFDYYLTKFDNFLPSAQQRWCTVKLKLLPFEKFIGTDDAITYIAIRADEPGRIGYISKKQNIKARFPFIEDNICKPDVIQILEESGVGIPKYYEWRSRSGCYFCFFQRKAEWLGLYENHPDLFEKAKQFEKIDAESGERYTWSRSESLDELLARADNILSIPLRQKKMHRRAYLMEIALYDEKEDQDNRACPICRL